VSRIEPPPAQQSNADRLEVIRAHPQVIRRRQIGAGGDWFISDCKNRIPVRAFYRQRLRQRGGTYSRRSLYARQAFFIKNASRLRRVFFVRQLKPHRQQIAGVEAEIDAQQVVHGTQEQSRASQQDERQADLGDQQGFAHSFARCACSQASAIFQRVL